MTAEEREDALVAQIEKTLRKYFDAGGATPLVIETAGTDWYVMPLGSSPAVKAEIRAAVEEEREALIPAIEEAALTLTEYHIKLPEQLARALEDRDG